MEIPNPTRLLVLLALVVILAVADLGATTVLQMNLKELCERSDRIFRGTVIHVTENTVETGGGRLPAITYQVLVNEAFKGSYPSRNGARIAEIRMIGTMKHLEAGRPIIPGFPQLQVGGEYLLMIARPGPSGLTNVVGLGQGCFHILGNAGSEMAVNEAGNAGLRELANLRPAHLVNRIADQALNMETVEDNLGVDSYRRCVLSTRASVTSPMNEKTID